MDEERRHSLPGQVSQRSSDSGERWEFWDVLRFFSQSDPVEGQDDRTR